MTESRERYENPHRRRKARMGSRTGQAVFCDYLGGEVMCKYCEEGKRGKFKGRKPDFIIFQDRFVVRIEKDEPYIGDYGLTVSDNEECVEYTEKINFCPMCGRKLTNQ